MRGRVDSQGEIYHTFNVQDLIPVNHPLREIKIRADRILAGMSRDFNAAYGKTGRPGIPPERLIKALLSHSVHVLMENGSGLCPDVPVDEANGRAEPEQAVAMPARAPPPRRIQQEGPRAGPYGGWRS